MTLAETDIKSYFCDECCKIRSPIIFKVDFFLENGHESPGLAPWVHLTCQVVLGKSLVSSISLAVQWRTGLGDFQFSFWIKKEKYDSVCSVSLPFECVYSLQENLKNTDQIY